jgi:hypothetical protein
MKILSTHIQYQQKGHEAKRLASQFNGSKRGCASKSAPAAPSSLLIGLLPSPPVLPLRLSLETAAALPYPYTPATDPRLGCTSHQRPISLWSVLRGPRRERLDVCGIRPTTDSGRSSPSSPSPPNAASPLTCLAR